MKIIQLQAENVKRLSAVNIKPDGSTVVVGGFNGQGKSSVLDSIMYALGGADSLPSKPLRNGTDKGRVVVKLDGMEVTRTFTRKKSTDDSPEQVTTRLEIKNADGFKASSPQQILDELCGKMAFDPLEFSRLKPKAQLESLKQLVGLDFTDIDAERAKLFEKRSDVNRAAKAKAGELAGCPKVEAPEVFVSVDELMAELEKRQAANRVKHEKKAEAHQGDHKIVGAATAVKSVVKEIEQAKQRLADWENELKAREKYRADIEREAADLKKAADALPEFECDSIHDKIRSAESVNNSIRQNQKHAQLAKAVADMEGDSESITAKIEAIDKQKSAAMAAAPFPVTGLGFDATGVTLNDLPFDQASSAEQLRVSVAMGLAINPKLRVMLIRDGSLLDSDSLELVGKMASEADAQVWIERVGEGEEVSVVIEDGHVKAEVEADAEAVTA